MSKILGISCFYHDSAACIVDNGEIIAAAQEERFTRKKHDFTFPVHAVNYCLQESKSTASDLGWVVFYDKPFIKFERIIETSLAYAPSGLRQFIQALPLWLKEKIWIKELLREKLCYNGPLLFARHHESHAASAFYPSPFRNAAFLTIDGVGEWETASFGIGQDNAIETLASLHFPHSLGLLYAAFTFYVGFKVNSGEYKLMGLAPYGEPIYAQRIMEELIDLKNDGSFRMNMRYFGYCNGLRMINRRFEDLFGGPPRKPETAICKKDMDVAASIQSVTEEIVLRMARHVKKVTGRNKLCLAGGVALNCVANSRLIQEGIFQEVWIQPASGDAGGALGAALLVWYKYLQHKRSVDELHDMQKGSLLGPLYDDSSIEPCLIDNAVRYEQLSWEEIPQKIARLLSERNVIGWFESRMEFGPRALGSRSILGDPRDPDMQSIMNLKIKHRESFRPFAPVVLYEKVSEWFDFSKESPYMLLIAPVKKEKRLPAEKNLAGLEKLKMRRSLIPAVTHVDYTSRIQTIKRSDNPLLYDTLQEFNKTTGCPLLINTSFNVRGEPLVGSPEDALKCFMKTEMDYLLMGRFLIDKKKQHFTKTDGDWKQPLVLD